jgi:hypothetical protein
MSSTDAAVVPPILPSCVATSLSRSSGYSCRGIVPPRDDAAASGGGTRVDSVVQLLACSDAEQVSLPPWAVAILRRCASATT